MYGYHIKASFLMWFKRWGDTFDLESAAKSMRNRCKIAAKSPPNYPHNRPWLVKRPETWKCQSINWLRNKRSRCGALDRGEFLLNISCTNTFTRDEKVSTLLHLESDVGINISAICSGRYILACCCWSPRDLRTSLSAHKPAALDGWQSGYRK